MITRITPRIPSSTPTHSICTLEFEVHRPLYDWILEQLKTPCHPQQIEFAQLNLSYTVMSKRKLLQLVEENLITGWDDPRMPTIAGLRRRGVTPEAIRHFCARIGVTKYNGLTDVALLEHSVRGEDLNKRARVMAALPPAQDRAHQLSRGQGGGIGGRQQSRRPRRRLAQGSLLARALRRTRRFHGSPRQEILPPFAREQEVRLHYAYIIKCVNVVKDAAGQITELQCTIDPDSKSGGATSAAKSRHHPLGRGRARDGRRSPPLQPPVHRRSAGRRQEDAISKPS